MITCITLNDLNVFIVIFFLTDNVALHKTAYQTNPYRKDNDSFDASNAVDGLKSNLAWSGGQCAVSALKEETATWWVDLGSRFFVKMTMLTFENISFF